MNKNNAKSQPRLSVVTHEEGLIAHTQSGANDARNVRHDRSLAHRATTWTENKNCANFRTPFSLLNTTPELLDGDLLALPTGSIDDWLRLAYTDVPERLWPAASRSLLAHLERLDEQRRPTSQA
ncbi:hypothetical protein F6X37_14070 [Paraburkholderia sp. 31.1]|uniref:hypothetical protein n=1 Tax=Paraburkholderia sp. 31.1 TaxID=2615205 RepID=UPI001E158759|nr:hypothetical protein [Paraburkholderia sp. 31.1]